MIQTPIGTASGAPAGVVHKAAKQLAHDGRDETAIALLIGLLERSEKRLTLHERAHVHADLGMCLWPRGFMANAREHAERVVALAEQSDDTEARAAAVFALGEVSYCEAAYYDMKDLAESMRLHERALGLHRDLEGRSYEALPLSRIGVIHELQQRQKAAQACYREALRIAEERMIQECGPQSLGIPNCGCKPEVAIA